MEKKDKRFIKIYKEGLMEGGQIWVDTETGVQYLVIFSGYGIALTPLLGPDGKPIISPLPVEEGLD